MGVESSKVKVITPPTGEPFPVVHSMLFKIDVSEAIKMLKEKGALPAKAYCWFMGDDVVYLTVLGEVPQSAND